MADDNCPRFPAGHTIWPIESSDHTFKRRRIHDPAATRPIQPLPQTAQQDVVSTMIPYHNVPALVAYYLGIFSLIPCLGLPMGIVEMPRCWALWV